MSRNCSHCGADANRLRLTTNGGCCLVTVSFILAGAILVGAVFAGFMYHLGVLEWMIRGWVWRTFFLVICPILIFSLLTVRSIATNVFKYDYRDNVTCLDCRHSWRV